jgi:hypothetical protein
MNSKLNVCIMLRVAGCTSVQLLQKLSSLTGALLDRQMYKVQRSARKLIPPLTPLLVIQ